MKKSPKKILFVITQGVWGGSQRYVFDLATEFSKEHTVTVAIGEPNGAQDLQKKITEQRAVNSNQNEIHLIQLKHLQRAINPFHDTMALFELRKLYKKLQPDIVHLNSSKAGILGSIANLITDHCSLTIVYTVHGWVFLEPLPNIIKKLFVWLEKITAPLKKAIIVLSPEEKEVAHNTLHLSNKKVHLIPLGIPTPAVTLSVSEARAQLQHITKQTYQEQKWIGTIAGLYTTKGLDTLLNTIATSKELQKNTHYFLIGEGPERGFLEHIIASHHLSNTITLTGHIDEAAQLLPAFDAFVLPSKKEGLPYVLLEALQANVPIVATAVGGVPSLLSQHKGATIISPQNTEQLKQALISVLSQPKSSLNHSIPSSFQKMITSTLELYSSLSPAEECY